MTGNNESVLPGSSETDSAGSAGAPESPATPTLSILNVAFISTFCAAVVVSVALVIYLKFFDKDTRFAVVNVEEIMEAKQLQLASLVSKPSATDKDRGAAYEMAASFGSDLHNALKTTQEECECVILASAAVVTDSTLDLTGRIKELVGLGAMDVGAMKKQFEENMRLVPKDSGAK